jgi:CubicO group peptidase (beta-lactamase class C family)
MLFVAGSAAAPAQLPNRTTASRDSAIALLQRDLPKWMQQGAVPGLAVAIVRDGRTEWVGNFGVADKATNRPVDDHTRFSAASLSKTVFSYAVLKLVDQGKLDLDAPLTRYVSPPIISDPRLERITARMALSHRTGFPNWRPRGGELKIFFPPGERFSYSGEGVVYLQQAVEAIEGKPLDAVVRELVFEPLGMSESSYNWRPAAAPFAATGYSTNGRSRSLAATADTIHGNAAASLMTTARDYARFIEAVLNGRGLKPATLRAMETPQVAVDPTCTNCLSHPPDSLSKQLFWGLGWGIERSATGKYLWHWGDNGDFKAYVVADPVRRSAVVMFDNSETGLSVARPVVQTVLGGEHPSFAWLNYDNYDSPAMRFAFVMNARGAAQALNEFSSELVSGAIPEQALNTAGYRLLRENQVADAIAVFRRNVELHPASANVYDSLGEAYAAAGDTARAIASYEKVLTIDPQSDNARAALAKLRAATPASSP